MELPEGINQYDLTKYQNRFTNEDVENFIFILEGVKNKKIADEYSINNLLRLLYSVKDSMKNRDEIQLKLNSLVLSQVAMDKKYDKSLFGKLLEFISI